MFPYLYRLIKDVYIYRGSYNCRQYQYVIPRVNLCAATLQIMLQSV